MLDNFLHNSYTRMLSTEKRYIDDCLTHWKYNIIYIISSLKIYYIKFNCNYNRKKGPHV